MQFDKSSLIGAGLLVMIAILWIGSLFAYDPLDEVDTLIDVDTILVIHNVRNPEDRGDANGSGEIDIDDITTLIWYIFQGGPHPGRLDIILERYVCIDSVIISGSGDTIESWKSGPIYKGLYID